MDQVTAHVVERMEQRLKRKLTGDDYNGLCQAAKSGLIVAQKSHATHRLVRFKRKWTVVVFCDRKQRVFTCWRASPSLITKAREGAL